MFSIDISSDGVIFMDSFRGRIESPVLKGRGGGGGGRFSMQ